MIKFSEKQRNFLRRPFDYTLEVNEGTPRSGKTTAGVFRYALQLIKSPDSNHLICAYNQEQAYRLVIDCDGFGLQNFFQDACRIKHDEHGDHLLIKTASGTKRVYYKGGGKADSHRSITGMSLGSVYFAEINLLHMNCIQECFRRTYAAKLRYHLADLNPPAPNDPVIKEVFEVQKTRWLHWLPTDNPALTEDRLKELYDSLVQIPYLLKRDWYGLRSVPEGVIYSIFDEDKHIINELPKDENERVIEMFFTGDGGQSDATSCSCNIVTYNYLEQRYKLYRVANYYHSGEETGIVKAMSVYAKEIIDFIAICENEYDMKHSFIAIDPACKSLREELHLLEYLTVPAKNNSKDVKGTSKGIEVGIERALNLLSQEQFYLVKSKFKNEKYDHYDFIKEIGLYCRDKNKKPVDKYNHAMDEFRYSVNYFYIQYVN